MSDEKQTITEKEVGTLEQLGIAADNSGEEGPKPHTPQDPEPEPAPPTEKVVMAQFVTGEDVNRNAFKDWLKACPFSQEGGQAIEWIRNPKNIVTAKIKVQVPVELEEDEFNAWAQTQPFAPAHKVEVFHKPDALGYFLAPEPPKEEPAPEAAAEEGKAAA